MNEYQKRLSELLIKSTLTVGHYKPSQSVMTGDHAAVFSNRKPVYLSGPADDALSVSHAEKLAKSATFAHGLKKIGFDGPLSSGVVKGSDIDWQPVYSAVVQSESGIVENGQGEGLLIGINLTQNKGLTTLMCVHTSIAQILDPMCPELDDGQIFELAHEF